MDHRVGRGAGIWLAGAAALACCGPAWAQDSRFNAIFVGSGVARPAVALPAGTVVFQGANPQVAPGAGSVILTPSGAAAPAGPVYFLTGSQLSGPGITLDLAAFANAPLKLDALPETAREAGDSDVRSGRLLSGGKTFFIGPEAGLFNRSGTQAVLLAPGTSGELGDLRIPFVRVHVAAPAGKPLDVDSLVARRPQIGMFNALFLPAGTRIGETNTTALARAAAPVTPAMPVMPVSFAMPAVERGEPPAIAAFAAPVEERSMTVLEMPPAPVEERVLVAIAPAAPEERAAVALKLIPTLVEPPAAPARKPEAVRAVFEPVRVAAAPAQKPLLQLRMDRKGGLFFM